MGRKKFGSHAAVGRGKRPRCSDSNAFATLPNILLFTSSTPLLLFFEGYEHELTGAGAIPNCDKLKSGVQVHN
jgi:hypothetical protein